MVDVGAVLYDAAVLVDEKVTTGTTSAVNWAALGADAASILVPMTVGAGAAVRAGVSVANKADNVADALKSVDKVGDTKKIGPAGDAGATVTKQIPDKWIKKTSDNKQGTKFLDPENPSGNNVRVQSGNPKSPNPAQRKPYVKEMKNGKSVDANGKQVDSKSPDSHIPKEDFNYKKK